MKSISNDQFNMVFKSSLLTLVIFGALPVTALCFASTANPGFRTVALTGWHAPGTPDGTVFKSFGPASINAAGKTAFWAELAGGSVNSSNQFGMWSESFGTLEMVLRQGQQADGTPPGVKWNGFTVPIISDDGQIGFSGFLLVGEGGVTDSNDSGVWSGYPGSLTLVAREGSQQPGLPAGTKFNGFFAPAFNGTGNLAFPVYTQSGVSGVWAESSGSLNLIASGGHQAPGLPSGSLFKELNAPVYNRADQIAFRATLQTGGGGVTTNSDVGIWSGISGTLHSVVREGAQAPDTPAGALFDDFGEPGLNSFGHTAFWANLKVGNGGVTTSNNMGIWAEKSGVLSLVAREGSDAPGGPQGAKFAFFETPMISPTGRTAFLARMQTSANVTISNDGGIWSEASGTLKLIAREGDVAVGAPAGYVFERFERPVANSSGRLAFSAYLQCLPPSPPFEPPPLNGIWVEDTEGSIQKVVLTGDLVEVLPGVFRTIRSVQPLGHETRGVSGGDDGNSVKFNDDFTLVFELLFTDDSRGVFTTSLLIPEPNVAALLLLCGLLFGVPYRTARS